VNEEALAHWGGGAVAPGGEEKRKGGGMRHYIQYGGAEKITVIKDPMVCSLVLKRQGPRHRKTT